MRGCALFAAIVAGCSAPEYQRMSGEGYYSWMASAHSPVSQFRERRLEGEGICFHLDGGKAQVLGFATLDDISSAAQRNPDLRMRAIVYQQAFAEGMLKGMTDTLNGSALTPEQTTRLRRELDAPADLREYVSDWRRGWLRGYGNGEWYSRIMDHGLAEP